MNRALLATLFAAGLCLQSQAGVMRSGFDAASLGRNDDSSSIARSLEFSNPINFGGSSYTKLFVNNNGNVTFDAALSAFTPFGIGSLNRAIIAPFFADVDTRNSLSGVASYGAGIVDGYQAFGVTWRDVGYYNSKSDKLNSFQLVLINRPDTGVGNFDFEFNYEKIQWEVGQSSGGATAAAGFAGPPGQSAFELAGSNIAGSFLDSNFASGLIYNSNIGVNGRYLFQVRNGMVTQCTEFTPIPEPTTAVFGVALASMCATSRRRSRPARSGVA